jgi:hypothetical protein
MEGVFKPMINFDLFYEYINDADMAAHQAWMRKVAAERRDLRRWAERQVLLVYVLCMGRRRRETHTS